MNNLIENNKVEIIGEVSKEAEFSHELYGEKFYKIFVIARRMSGYEDEIPVTVSDHLVNPDEFSVKQRVRIFGRLNSYNHRDELKKRLILSVFAQEIEFMDDMQSDLEENNIFLDGYICKEPIYRKTPLGRDISNLLLAVNRSYGKSDYIPCIVWGRNARFASDFELGTHVIIRGRIQSREYEKRISDEEVEKRTAYEVSGSQIELAEVE